MDDSSKVRVMVRCRPLLPRELVGGSVGRATMKMSTDMKQMQIGESRDVKVYNFDRVFDEKCNQETVYDVCVRNLVEGCFSGYNATVLACSGHCQSIILLSLTFSFNFRWPNWKRWGSSQ
jgi:hypothetical protein